MFQRAPFRCSGCSEVHDCVLSLSVEDALEFSLELSWQTQVCWKTGTEFEIVVSIIPLRDAQSDEHCFCAIFVKAEEASAVAISIWDILAWSSLALPTTSEALNKTKSMSAFPSGVYQMAQKNKWPSNNHFFINNIPFASRGCSTFALASWGASVARPRFRQLFVGSLLRNCLHWNICCTGTGSSELCCISVNHCYWIARLYFLFVIIYFVAVTIALSGGM